MNIKINRVIWVCFDCAKKAKARIPKDHCYTVHVDKCTICKRKVEVTEPRDFGKTRILIDNLYLNQLKKKSNGQSK